jgi:meiotically up-regulated gene 157 (Mug157) protein
MTLYRSSSKNCDQSLNRLETILNVLHKPKPEFVICGDINVTFLNDNRKQNLHSLLLLSYNLSRTVNYPIRVQNNYSSVIDNIYSDNSKLENYSVKPLINGLSDHEARKKLPQI